jgi:hypothetical protein
MSKLELGGYAKMTTASTDLAYPGDATCHDCKREISVDSAAVYLLEDGLLAGLCEECAENWRRAAAARMAKTEAVDKWD